MNINQAIGLVNDIESLLYSGSGWDFFWRDVFNEIRAGDVDGLFTEALVKLDALGALNHELDQFINDFIRVQLHRFYNDLYRNRRWHLINGHVYTYSDVLKFTEESKELIQLLRKKVGKMGSEHSSIPYKVMNSDEIVKVALTKLVQNPNSVKSLSESMLNIKSKTAGGYVWWDDLGGFKGWRVQKNTLAGHCRILDDSNTRVAWWTNEQSMMTTLRRFVSY